MPKAIEIENFSYKYSDGTIALSGITLSIEHGRRVALIGPNGAGKSTLLLAMAGFVKGTGKVSIDGLQINKKNVKKIRASLGSCLENPDDQLFMPTLFDDVAFGPLNMGLEVEQVKKCVADAPADRRAFGNDRQSSPSSLSRAKTCRRNRNYTFYVAEDNHARRT